MPSVQVRTTFWMDMAAPIPLSFGLCVCPLDPARSDCHGWSSQGRKSVTPRSCVRRWPSTKGRGSTEGDAFFAAFRSAPKAIAAAAAVQQRLAQERWPQGRLCACGSALTAARGALVVTAMWASMSIALNPATPQAEGATPSPVT